MPPLTRATSTMAEQITLPSYPAIYLALGATFLMQDPLRTQGASFDTARSAGSFIPGVDGLTIWAVLFVAIGLVEAAALIFHWSHLIYIRALIVGSGLAAFWVGALLVSALNSTSASFTSAEWLMIPVLAQAASARHLARFSHPSLSAFP